MRRAAKTTAASPHAAGAADVMGIGGGAMATGEAAVEASRYIVEDRWEAIAPGSPRVDVGGREVIRHVGEKTFVFDGQRWLDTAWDGEKKPTKLIAFSDEYFALLAEHPQLGRYFALGERVVVVFEATVYEIAPESESGSAP